MVYWNKKLDLSDCYSVVKTRVKNCKYLPSTIVKAGIILYTSHDGEIIFGLGTDSSTHNIRDFSINVKSTDNIFNLMLQSLDIQLSNIFEQLQLKDIMECPVLYDKERLILLLHLNVDPEELSKRFIEKHNEDNGICCITWFTSIDFNHNISHKNNFDYNMKNFLYKTQNFSYLL